MPWRRVTYATAVLLASLISSELFTADSVVGGSAPTGSARDEARDSGKQDWAAKRLKQYRDISLGELPERLVFANSQMKLDFDKRDGSWLSLTTDGVPGSLIAPEKPGAAIDFRVEDEWMVESYGAVFLRHEVWVDEAKDAVMSCCAPWTATIRGCSRACAGWATITCWLQYRSAIRRSERI